MTQYCCTVMAHQLDNKERSDRKAGGQLRPLAAEIPSRISEEDLGNARFGTGEGRVHELRRVRGGMKGVLA